MDQHLKMHRIIKFNQEAQLRIYVNTKKKLKKNSKKDFKKDFFKLMNNAVLIRKCGKSRNNKLIETETRRNFLVLKPN